jgi:hypothetical protein
MTRRKARDLTLVVAPEEKSEVSSQTPVAPRAIPAAHTAADYRRLALVYETEREWRLAAEALDGALALYALDGGASAANDRLRLAERRDVYLHMAVTAEAGNYVSSPGLCSPGCRGWAVFNEGDEPAPLGVIQRCDECGWVPDDAIAAGLARAAGYRVEYRDGVGWVVLDFRGNEQE